mgnify:CR=1 FL=1
MNRDELEKRNVGENLDSLMNLDPRGYGVCRILYAGSRKATGEPLTMHAAQALVDTVKAGDVEMVAATVLKKSRAAGVLRNFKVK